MNFDIELFFRLLTAVSLGALIGAEREMKKVSEEPNQFSFAGLRTYTLISMMGFVGAYLSDYFGFIVLSVLLLAVILFFFGAYMTESHRPGFFGITSEISAVITFLAGALSLQAPLLAAILSIFTVLILALKKPLHHFVHTLTPVEFLSAIKFIIIAFIVLPVLPHDPIDPWGVVVLFDAWLMVVFVSAISFIGYFSIRVIGARKGIGLTALVGGLASSTATTISLSQQEKANRKLVLPFVFGVMVTSCVMFIRAILEVAVINPSLLPLVIFILGFMVFSSLIVILWLWWQMRSDKGLTKTDEIKLSSPFRFLPALQLGLLYIVILLVAEFGNRYLGDRGVYFASAFAGIADIDAITLSLSNLSATGNLSMDTAARGITIAVMTNTAVKLGIVRIFGSSGLFYRCLVGLGIVFASGLLAMLAI